MSKINLDSTITFVVAKNPRRESSAGYGVYAHYVPGRTIRAVIAAIDAAGIAKSRDHVRWDLNHGAIRCGEPSAPTIALPEVAVPAAEAQKRAIEFFAAAMTPRPVVIPPAEVIARLSRRERRAAAQA